MQVIFESRDPQAAQMREVAVRRVRLALRRLTWLVPRARVQLTDVNAGRGGIDKRCQVELVAEGMAPVVVTSMARHWRVALQSALSRAVVSLLRHWGRAKDQRVRVPAIAGESHRRLSSAERMAQPSRS
ncbi:MAG TPA: HPF/RaiA family ribosome-associated protein [Polaromonas sp.]|uniref:HPF/RaiA family ribosome-associated protein n=1 Tax=Polaromonas sp. TaxID=1869339 RepID=UPI002D31A397|nr:HPF/RaiA family ribosome-associated protein [Polaromonas sp.]HYW56562.1 HPF/RaiA family ribosome-associated protein [Polaromonas sp.]